MAVGFRNSHLDVRKVVLQRISKVFAIYAFILATLDFLKFAIPHFSAVATETIGSTSVYQVLIGDSAKRLFVILAPVWNELRATLLRALPVFVRWLSKVVAVTRMIVQFGSVYTRVSVLLNVALLSIIVGLQFEADTVTTLTGRTYEMLRTSLKSKMQAFALTLRNIRYLGVHPTIQLPASEPVRYPVSYFITNLYERFASVRGAIARATYKRVNPTSVLKLRALAKFDNAQRFRDDHFVNEFRELARETALGFTQEFTSRLLRRLRAFHDFSDVSFEGSSAAGYPYKSGTKRRDVADQACASAEAAMFSIANGESPDDVFANEVWYTTGRAKLLPPHKDDDARLVIYSPFKTFLIMQKYSEVFTDFFVKSGPSWSAIGFSWFHRGADRLLKNFFGCKFGRAPPGQKLASLDLSSWDSKLDRSLLFGACEYHVEILRQVLDPVSFDIWSRTLRAAYRSFIDAKVMLPGGHVFQTCGGMKSGWNFTSIDNTIVHEVLFRRVSRAVTPQGVVVPHKLYGDDNLFMWPEELSTEPIFAEYAKYGCVVRFVHASHLTSDVDFLSKNLCYSETHDVFFPFRPTVETDARLLMPEHFNPAEVPALEQVAAAEAILGHLIDNFWNQEVRDCCYKMLTCIRDDYRVTEVEIGRAFRMFQYKGFDFSQFRTTLPTVLSRDVIRELYGMPFLLPTDSAFAGPNLAVDPPFFSMHIRDRIEEGAVAAESFASSIEIFSLRRLGVSGSNMIKRMLRVFRIPDVARGTAGMKALEAIRRIGCSPNSVLDIGSHPGSCVQAIYNFFPNSKITAVSRMFRRDFERGEPFMFKAPVDPARVKVIQRDALKYNPEQKFDHCHIDVGFEDIYDSLSSYAERAELHFSRIIPFVEKFMRSCSTMSVVLPGLTSQCASKLTEWSNRCSNFTIIKPRFSYPWNTEVCLCLRLGTCIRPVRRSAMQQSICAFRNQLATRLTIWSSLRSHYVTAYFMGLSVDRNPLQGDTAFQTEMRRKVFPSEQASPPT